MHNEISIFNRAKELNVKGYVLKEFSTDVLEDCINACLLYTSDAADERSSVDLGGRRIIKKKKKANSISHHNHSNN